MTMVKIVITFEDLDKSSLEGAIEDGIDDGVDCGRYVAQPQTYIGQVIRHLTRRTRSKINIQDEERCPAYNESEEHDT